MTGVFSSVDTVTGKRGVRLWESRLSNKRKSRVLYVDAGE